MESSCAPSCTRQTLLHPAIICFALFKATWTRKTKKTTMTSIPISTTFFASKLPDFYKSGIDQLPKRWAIFANNTVVIDVVSLCRKIKILLRKNPSELSCQPDKFNGFWPPWPVWCCSRLAWCFHHPSHLFYHVKYKKDLTKKTRGITDKLLKQSNNPISTTLFCVEFSAWLLVWRQNI